ncbi:DegT/DnrJ/EryC1/StrS aminotransferase family protein [Geobacter sp. SVR]|uniref:DegT/DnrJ/EryC1/StrS family aminotransferase n=1 Tax=Geobacter sp. SVR TaxID=2495594 RepID=UPI00143EF4D2|nr:DegT/DnrJ/EryC1/StrS family aminotransferase [Geobacter sp. SVR]BCS54975.1 aminotransferase DegT [Geobacter sp. SVR]GCF85157.1 aminotransferase DegT [Geobacter sp. SVR]
MIPITRLSVGDAEATAAAEAVRSGWLSSGKRVQEFETMVADYVGARHAVATNSCTTALQLALIAAGVKPGDEVICPSFSFIATANAILYAGAVPVFVDIDPRTYNIDPGLIEAAITPRTTAIMPVSQIGLAADIPAIMAIARQHGLKVVEDAAPSLGARVGTVCLGSLSDFTCFSFDPRKILTTGEGGVITTNDDEAAERLRSMRAHSASVSAIARHTSTSAILESYPEIGYNYKLTDIQGAIGVVQMGRIEQIIAERRRLADRFASLLADEQRIQLPYEPPGYFHVYQSYCIRLLGDRTQVEVMERLARQDIAARRIIAIHQEPLYRERTTGRPLPETERATKETLLLPMFVGLSDAEQDEVVLALKRALD